MKKQFKFKDVKLKPSYFGSTIIGDVKVDMELTNKENQGPVLSIMASMHNVMSGQCLNPLMESTLKDDPLFCQIHDLWSKYHLNSMHAGTPKQEALINEGILSGELKNRDYTSVCVYLKTKKCYIDNDLLDENGQGYRYGHKWLYQPIPENDLTLIKKLITGGETKCQ